MGKIKQGILGGFSGKVAGVVGTSWKGRAIIKARPLSVANPRTAGQVGQRTSFSLVAKIGSIILTYIMRTVYNPIAGNVSGYNKFTSENKQMFDSVGNFQFAETSIGGGTLPHDQINSLDYESASENINVAWSMPASTSALRQTDKVYCYVIEPLSKTVWAVAGEDTRADEATACAKVSGSVDLTGTKTVYGYLAYVDEAGRLVSIKASGYSESIVFSSPS